MLTAAFMTFGIVAVLVASVIVIARLDQRSQQTVTFRCDRCRITWEGHDAVLINRIAAVHDCIKQSARNTV